MTPTIPERFIPDGHIQLTEYTEDLAALAEDVARGEESDPPEVLDTLDTLVNEYKVPVTEAERSVRITYGDKDQPTTDDPDLPKKYGWEL